MIEVKYPTTQNIKATVVAAFIRASRPEESVRIRLTRRPIDSHLALYESDGKTPRQDTNALIPALRSEFARLFDARL